jgi:hypothetical protein
MKAKVVVFCLLDGSSKKSNYHCLIETKYFIFSLRPKHLFMSQQTSDAYWHVKIACSTVSSLPQRSHMRCRDVSVLECLLASSPKTSFITLPLCFGRCLNRPFYMYHFDPCLLLFHCFINSFELISSIRETILSRGLKPNFLQVSKCSKGYN